MKRLLLSVTLLFATLTPLTIFAGQGGPDTYGYTWIDSDEANGPVYAWFDIEQEANKVQGLGDDNVVGPFPINGTFPYYWYTVDKFWVGSNGYISFNNVNIASPFPFIPSPSKPNDYIAALTSDLNFDGAGNPAKCYYFETNDTVCISWVDVPFWDQISGYTGSNTFQIILNKADSSITVNYKEQTGFTQNGDITIGIEDITGGIGLEHSKNIYPIAPYSIRYEYPDSVTLAVTDGSAAWNGNEDGKGIFIPTNGQPLEMVSNIKNVGNQNIPPFNADMTVYDANFSAVLTDNANLNQLDAGRDTSITFASSFQPTTAGIYMFETLISGIVGDFTFDNDYTQQEIVAVDTTQTQMNLSFTNSVANGPGVSWLGGGGGIAVYFEPPMYPVQINRTNFQISANGATPAGFDAIIYDDDGPNGGPGTILDSVNVPGTSVVVGNNAVTPSTNIVISDGGFYVLWQMDGEGITLASDIDPPFSRQCFEVLGGIWADYRDQENADFFISVDIQENVIMDAGVLSIANPAEGEFVTTADSVVIWVKNYGDGDLGPFNVVYQLGTASPNGQIYNGTPIAPGDSGKVKFNKTLVSNEPNQTLCVWPSVPFDNDLSNDTVCIDLNPSTPGDLAVSAINSPQPGVILSQNTDVTITIDNLGPDPDKLFSVFYKKGGSQFSEVYTGDVINASQSTQYTFSLPTTPSLPGEQFCAWVDKANDNNRTNDTMCFALHTSIAPIVGVGALTVYPNPFTNQLQLELPQQLTDGVVIEVFNVLGKQVKREAYGQQNLSSITLDMQALSAGVYTYRVLSGGQMWSGKVVKE